MKRYGNLWNEIIAFSNLLKAAQQAQPKRKWSDLKGTALYPLLGEDAQEWVSRTRREGDEHRERLLRGDSFSS